MSGGAIVWLSVQAVAEPWKGGGTDTSQHTVLANSVKAK
jgi:hypothetical protein